VTLRAEGHLDRPCPCVSRDVGQRLLRDPEDHQLGRVVEGRQTRHDAAPDVGLDVGEQVRGQRGQRAAQPEVLEHVGT
jgi:hypothetical protein